MARVWYTKNQVQNEINQGSYYVEYLISIFRIQLEKMFVQNTLRTGPVVYRRICSKFWQHFRFSGCQYGHYADICVSTLFLPKT